MIRQYADLESLSHAAAELFVQLAGQAVEARGQFSVVLSGGDTPRRTYQLLAESPFREQVPWGGVHVFWGDERCVPPEDPRSNGRMAHEALLSQVPILPTHVYPITCGPAPEEAARQYEDTLRNFFRGQRPRFDLVFLGLGINGHTASLFPETAALEEQGRWTAAVYVPADALHRVTLTASLINQARTVAFLVAGADKVEIMRQVLEGPRDICRLPAQLIQPTQGELLWLVDREAGRLLVERVCYGAGQ
ncbi:MAG: 6-phosphogluconolactonase [Chloroflexota bacterium]